MLDFLISLILSCVLRKNISLDVVQPLKLLDVNNFPLNPEAQDGEKKSTEVCLLNNCYFISTNKGYMELCISVNLQQ